jgi:hypothetical protein
MILIIGFPNKKLYQGIIYEHGDGNIEYELLQTNNLPKLSLYLLATIVYNEQSTITYGDLKHSNFPTNEWLCHNNYLYIFWWVNPSNISGAKLWLFLHLIMTSSYHKVIPLENMSQNQTSFLTHRTLFSVFVTTNYWIWVVHSWRMGRYKHEDLYPRSSVGVCIFYWLSGAQVLSS